MLEITVCVEELQIPLFFKTGTKTKPWWSGKSSQQNTVHFIIIVKWKEEKQIFTKTINWIHLKWAKTVPMSQFHKNINSKFFNIWILEEILLHLSFLSLIFPERTKLFFFRALTFGGSKDLKCILNQNCLNCSVKNSNHGKPPHQKQSA